MRLVKTGNGQESQDDKQSFKLITSEINVLIDTGALDGDYVSIRVVSMYNIPMEKDSITWICAGTDSPCVPSIGQTRIQVSYLNEITMSYETIVLNPIVINGPTDLIIGKQSIYNNSLLLKLDEQIWGDMEKQVTGGPHRGDTLAGSPNPRHHPVVNHLCSIIHKGAYFGTEDEDELRYSICPHIRLFQSRCQRSDPSRPPSYNNRIIS
jgi:hypothetical protein